ncbi:MAG: hypothetical protein J6569_08390 [Gilliamella sp.]|uniref:hypothetical protein n=1 Tax=Gilliamella TaxID=1193503 RepID=UPI00080DBB5B|nr:MULTISPECIES: hypothetical protein [Gilliamella]MCO6537620.1 hypothetical protein [Gilliamella sp.]MCO6540139.1 hypothetical protein [Gilliamella sp.]MCO6550412.1 hypothetical protein [Gilliamella sp.]MCO6555174.1 hypothetical protein [Gilliamella sp.]MCO6557531.1 hypothetical protein [Gilliamella sp.]
MKRLFFLLTLSVMITACHDANQAPTTTDNAAIKQPSNDCLDNKSAHDSHLGKIPALGCPVK